jgi:hypothetical protein
MADKSALGLIGYLLAAVTAAVMMVGVLVVNNSIAGARDHGGNAMPAVSGTLALR